MKTQKSIEVLMQDVSNLFAALALCEENDVRFSISRNLDLEDLTGTVSYDVWVCNKLAPLQGFVGSANSISDAFSELYFILYNNALIKQKELGDVFVWAYGDAHKIISLQEDILQD